MRIRARQSGFTLFELIIALALTAILAASLSVSLRTAFKAGDSAEARIAPARSAQIALDLIGHDLENALPPTGILAGAFEGVDGGSGTGDTLEFFAIGHGTDDQNPTKNDGIWKIDIDVEPLADGTPALVRRVTKNLLSANQVIPDPEVLCRNVAGFDLQYYADDTWNTDWDSTQQNNTLPAAVQVNLVIHKPGTNTSEDYQMTRTYQLPCAVDPNASDGSGGTTQ